MKGVVDHPVFVLVDAVDLLLQGPGSAGQEGGEGVGEKPGVALPTNLVVHREDAREAAGVTVLELPPASRPSGSEPTCPSATVEQNVIKVGRNFYKQPTCPSATVEENIINMGREF